MKISSRLLGLEFSHALFILSIWHGQCRLSFISFVIILTAIPPMPKSNQPFGAKMVLMVKKSQAKFIEEISYGNHFSSRRRHPFT